MWTSGLEHWQEYEFGGGTGILALGQQLVHPTRGGKLSAAGLLANGVVPLNNNS